VSLTQLKLEYSKKDNPNDEICQTLARNFDDLKEKFKYDASVLIRSCKEQELTLKRKGIGQQLLRDMRFVAITSANWRIPTWNLRYDQQQCETKAAIIGNIAIKRLIEKSPLTPQLEQYLSIPSLSDIYETLVFEPVDPEDSITETESARTYDSLDSRIGRDIVIQHQENVHQDVHQVDMIVKELEKYIPHCTIGFTKNSWLVVQHKMLHGKLSARTVVKKLASATAATEHAMNYDEDAAAIANQQAQKATKGNNSTAKHPPKGKGGRNKNPPSKPNPKKGPKTDSKRKGGGIGSNGRGGAKGSESVSVNKRKQQQPTPFQAKRPAKSHDNEPIDKSTPTKKPRKRRSKSKAKGSLPTTETELGKPVSSSDSNTTTRRSHQRGPQQNHREGSRKRNR
jgi:hypothetical protein